MKLKSDVLLNNASLFVITQEIFNIMLRELL